MSSRIFKIINTALLSVACITLVACKDEVATVGGSAPDLATFDLQGNPVSLQEKQGKPLLLTFWSGACGICVEELSEFQKLQSQYPDNLQILAINIDGESANTEELVTKRNLVLPVVKDQLNITAERYQLKGTPTSFIIDSNGKILNKYEGLIPEEELEVLFKG
ncbi:TlpA family protein disulfide reductase [Otariodibacter oris]|uniref:Peroxiredoxin n=1 Tax=Otariodibacter oris TaxID=1032623 RepID=A0A420XJ51_9PAST|nr:TlpA disulfide reductase family protein [Otariodibacter oris]QGM80507.1 thioredoxin [Otariodibacter oris]RKR77342.1 peroxiredoxin [Otariodibacter oris]